MHRTRLTCTLILALVLCTSVSMTSCGGGSGGGANGDLVLLGFNVPNLSGIALNQPLIFTFSANINASTVTPDSLRVVGTASPDFEETVVDGNLIALLPTTPNFADYSDAGFQPDIVYTVSLTEFPAVTTIETTSGKPLLEAESFTFRTLPVRSADIVSNIRCNGPDGLVGTADDTTPGSPSFFIEPRRPIHRGSGWTQGLSGDDDGCLQNTAFGNDLFALPTVDPGALQIGSGPGARLLCLQNEGDPRVIESLCLPRHDAENIGDPSADTAGYIDLGSIHVKFNEPLDPLTVEPWFDGLGDNVQLWRVGLKDDSPLPGGPDQVLTNKPIVVQQIEDTEIIITANGPVPQGVYMVNVTQGIKDLPGCPLRISDRPSPAAGGHDVYESQTEFQDAVPDGYRIYFKTLEIPDTELAIIEDFGNNLAEWGDNDSAQEEPGLYSFSSYGGGPWGDQSMILHGGTGGIPVAPFGRLTFGGLGAPDGDPTGLLIGQSTTAAWNAGGFATATDSITSVSGYRFLNIPTLFPNINDPANPNIGSLQAVHQPWAGSGADFAFDSGGGGTVISWNTDTGSPNGDGIWEVTEFLLRAGDTLNVTGSKPLLILCQGNFELNGTLNLNGQPGKPGFDTDGSNAYTNPGASATAGVGGAGGPGGGAGGDGADPLNATTAGVRGVTARTLFEAYSDAAPHTGGTGGPTGTDAAGTAVGSVGGGGAGFSASGTAGSNNDATVTAAGGPPFGDPDFMRPIEFFQPDRGYFNNSNVGGGSGGGGGSADDDTNATNAEVGDDSAGNGDDAGGGGGGGGGGLYVLVRGTVSLGASAVISANGGDGGNTYGPGDQLIDPGADPMDPSDDVFQGALGTGPGSGQGGPGGGGAGGGIFIAAKGGFGALAGAVITAEGGAGGTSDSGARTGGAGADGRIRIWTFDSAPLTNAATSSPASVDSQGFEPAVDLASVGQSGWFDLTTPNAVFQAPTFHANFSLDALNPGYLEELIGNGGGGQVLGVDFDARLEFQGADNLNDDDFDREDPLTGFPVEADGLTPWVDAGNIFLINSKRYIRWRWRFYARNNYGVGGGYPPNLQLPTVFDFTIPFIKS